MNHNWPTVGLAVAVAAYAGLGCSSEVDESGGGAGQTTTATTSNGGTGGSGGQPGGSGGSGTGGEQPGGSGGTGGTGTGGTGTGGSGASGGGDCMALSDAIATQASGTHACTTIVRLAYQSQEILGFQILCGAYAQVDETAARATAQSDTGYGQSGTFLSGPEPIADEFVFYQAPGDFGGVGVVSARSGPSVFGGSIIWGGSGEITYPASWQPAADLGPDCIPETNALPPPGRGFDLNTAQPLTPTQVDNALSQAWVTALPDGLMQAGYVFDAMVLMYPRTVGALDPATAEWIVMVNSGWLE